MATSAVKLEEVTEFADVPLALQILATLIAIGVCIYEATYASRVRKIDNKERLEEYKKRYKWNSFNTSEMLNESDDFANLSSQPWWNEEVVEKE